MTEEKVLHVWTVQLRGHSFKIVATTAEEAIKKARSLSAGSQDLIGLQCGEKVDAVASKI